MFSRFFVRRPVFAWVIAILIMLAGMLAIQTLPVAQYPDVAPPTIQISAAYTRASADTLEKVSGQRPVGIRTPSWDFSPNTLAITRDMGLLYDSSLMADDIPYLMRTPQGELWEAPVHWGTDDWPPFAHYAEIDYLMPVKAPSEGLKAFWEEFDAQYEAGGFWMGIWHPFLTGRLARWRQVEQWLEQTLKTKKVWFAPLEDIIAHVKSVTASAVYKPRVETLPYYDRPQHAG